MLCALVVGVTCYFWIASYTAPKPDPWKHFYFGKPGDQTFLVVQEGRCVLVHSDGVGVWQRDVWYRANPFAISYYRRIGKWMPLWYTFSDSTKTARFTPTTFVAVPLWTIALATCVLPLIWLLRRRWTWWRSWGGRGFDVLAVKKGR